MNLLKKVSNQLKKTRTQLLLAILFVLSIAFAGFAFAQSANDLDIKDFQTNQSDKRFTQEDFVFGNFKNAVYSLSTITGGCQAGVTCTGVLAGKGALGASGDMVASLYNPPASGVEYVADVMRHMGIVQPAYAQTGTGFSALAPLLKLWRGMRDFTYLFFVILFVGMGLAVMFRMKLSPQTVITIQSALPRLIVALVLVTFSYAIAGLMIDFMYVLISLGALVFGTAGGASVPELQKQFTDGGFLGGLSALFALLPNPNPHPPAAASAGGFWGWLTGLAGTLNSLNPQMYISNTISHIVSAWWQTGSANAAIGKEILGSTLVRFIFIIVILWMILHLFFQLLQSYISIILLVILGPLQIALGVIPGFPSFGGWIKSLVGNLMVFVAVAYVLMIGQLMASGAAGTQGLWRPPLLFGSGLIADNIDSILALGILLIVHQVPAAVKGAFGIKGLGIFTPGEAWGGATSPITTPVTATWNAGQKTLTEAAAGRIPAIASSTASRIGRAAARVRP